MAGFGWSVGDVVAGVKIVVAVIEAFKEVDGAASKYKQALDFLTGLKTDLEHIQVYVAANPTAKYSADVVEHLLKLDGPFSALEANLLKYRKDLASTSKGLRKGQAIMRFTLHDLSNQVAKLQDTVKRSFDLIMPILTLQMLWVHPELKDDMGDSMLSRSDLADFKQGSKDALLNAHKCQQLAEAIKASGRCSQMQAIHLEHAEHHQVQLKKAEEILAEVRRHGQHIVEIKELASKTPETNPSEAGATPEINRSTTELSLCAEDREAIENIRNMIQDILAGSKESNPSSMTAANDDTRYSGDSVTPRGRYALAISTACAFAAGLISAAMARRPDNTTLGARRQLESVTAYNSNAWSHLPPRRPDARSIRERTSVTQQAGDLGRDAPSWRCPHCRCDTFKCATTSGCKHEHMTCDICIRLKSRWNTRPVISHSQAAEIDVSLSEAGPGDGSSLMENATHEYKDDGSKANEQDRLEESPSLLELISVRSSPKPTQHEPQSKALRRDTSYSSSGGRVGKRAPPDGWLCCQCCWENLNHESVCPNFDCRHHRCDACMRGRL